MRGKRGLLILFICALGLLLLAAPARTQAKSRRKLNHTVLTVTMETKTVPMKVSNSKGKKIRWTSSKPSVAAVDEKGLVTVKGKGNTLIKAKIGKEKLTCVLSVVSRKAYGALERAKKFYNAKNMSYSQGNRMGKRSADCSSFCGRCYLSQGMTLGGSRSWCNTAAGMAKWTSAHGKVVSNGKPTVSSLTLRPGDLVFYRRGYNGRYKNIYHVEIFVGYGWRNGRLVGYTMSSIIGNYPSILKRDYSSRRGRIAQVSRPAR